MSTTQICPGCKVRLVIRDRVRTEFITCPRCLVAVRNPLAGGVAPEPPARLAVAPGARMCTVCAEVLPGHASNCPASAAQRESRTWSAPPADREASGDSNGTWILAILLAGMVVASVWTTFGEFFGMILGMMLLIAILMGGKEAALGNVWRVIVTLAVLAGVLFALCFIAFLILCGGGGRKWGM